MNTPTRPASAADSAPIDFASLRLPPPPRDIAAMVVEMLQARKAHKLAVRGETESA